jgi:Kef-type K+ transport system membrane component KefB
MEPTLIAALAVSAASAASAPAAPASAASAASAAASAASQAAEAAGLAASSAMAVAGEAPLWALDNLRAADPMIGIVILVIVAVIAGEAFHRWMRLPRIVGQMLVGVLASPTALRLFEPIDLDPWKPLLDLAVGVLLFELGSRLRPRWLWDNPGLTLQCLAEALFAGAAVMVALVAIGAPTMSAALAAAVAMSTSPVITMAVLHEASPRGQVTERLLMMSSINSVLAVLAVKAWQVMSAADSSFPGSGSEWLTVGANAVFVLCGSFLLGTLLALALDALSRSLRDPSAGGVLQLALLVLAAVLAAQWTLSPLLALLVAGLVARWRMGHRLTVTPMLGTAGAALAVLLFLSIGLLANLQDLTRLWPWVLVLVGARLIGKAIGVATFARFSGMAWRQAAALTVALQPMAYSALLLGASSYGWSGAGPNVHSVVLQALLIATTLMQLSGPVWTLLGLKAIAGETPTRTPK